MPMKTVQKKKVSDVRVRREKSKKAYKAPKLVVHSGAEFVRKLGPAQACSGTPDFF